MKLFKGNIIFTKEKQAFDIIEDGFILSDEGKVLEVGHGLDDKYPDLEVIDYSNHLLIPGFVDLHFHAVQYGNLGIGLDEELLDWLNDYTFKEEAKFQDLTYARAIFDKAINHMIASGTTRMVFFSSIHQAAAELLMDLCSEKGVGAFVGKVNMDRNAPDSLLEDSDQSLEITRYLLENDREEAKAIITPRFVPSCSKDLMDRLGELASKGYPVQTHISENESEIEWVKSLHPEAKNYLDVYDKAGLITDKTILAHCVFCTEEERQVIFDKKAFVAHCPAANFNLTSGIMNAKLYLDKGIRIGLGTDVGAGHTPSIRQVIVEAIKMSKVNHMMDKTMPVLSLSEAFYMATKGGGQYFGKVGSFEKSYDLDMLVIKPDDLSLTRNMPILNQLQRFIYAGDNLMISAVYCKGKRLNAY
ncbi:guanine deaminase [Acidaminobacter sp. JC074]|uniref:amidohydrolase family protein n=1 Tax=Acidaminobacter sp. JC074 TaxID=2530199 RepID=UPI001F0E0606|nr:amidohydrolase family protein [Acidaminobacter sp. JC074]MCH4890758.1 guanine deaminase [Acidaminobacter sp. JC074]